MSFDKFGSNELFYSIPGKRELQEKSMIVSPMNLTTVTANEKCTKYIRFYRKNFNNFQ